MNPGSYSKKYLPVKRLLLRVIFGLVSSISTSISQPSSMIWFTKASGKLLLLNTRLFLFEDFPDLLDDGVFACPRNTGVTGKASSRRPSFVLPSEVESVLTSKKYCNSGRQTFIEEKFSIHNLTDLSRKKYSTSR